MRTPPKSLIWLAALPLLLLAVGLAAPGLNADTYWLDEIWSLKFAGGAHLGPLSPGEIISRTAEDAFSGPLYPLLLSAWGWAAGWMPFAARYSSLLLGVIAVALVYRLGRDLAAPGVGLAAAAGLTGSALLLYFFHELRNYTLALVILTALLIAYWRLITRRAAPGLALRAAFLLAWAALPYTHYYVALALPALALYHLLFAPKNRRWWLVVGLMAAGSLLFLPWALVALQALGEMDALQARVIGESYLGPAALTERALVFFSNGAPALLLAAPLALLGLKFWRRGTVAVLCWTALLLVGLMLANERTTLIRPGRERYLLTLWPTLALLLGLGAAALWRLKGRWRLMQAAAAALVGVWLLVGVQASRSGELLQETDGAKALPWHTLAAALAAEAQPGDAAAVHVTLGNWALEVETAQYHLYGLPVRFLVMLALDYQEQDKPFAQKAREFAGDAPRLWVGLDKRFPPGPTLDDFVGAVSAAGYAHCRTVFDLPRLKLDLYRRFPSAAFDPAAAIARFGDGIALTVSDVQLPSAERGLIVTTLWTVAPEVPPYTYSAALHIENAAGELVAQGDFGLPNAPAGCGEAHLAPDALPDGDYRLLAVVYNWSNGERLPGVAVASGSAGDRVPLAAFHVGE